MPVILGIDPGTTESAYCTIDAESRRPIEFAKVPNGVLIDIVQGSAADRCVVEMIDAMGMAVGAEIFETCVWVGRFAERWDASHTVAADRLYRPDIKLHHCMARGAKDSNVRIALVDRFARGASNFGKGTKASPGFFHGFSADVWQAFACAVAYSDLLEGVPHRLRLAA